MIHETTVSLKGGIVGVLRVVKDRAEILDERKLRESVIDDLIYTAVFSADEETRQVARWIIRCGGDAVGITSASIHGLYQAMGKKEEGGFTVPAINIRTLTYDTAQAVLRAAMRLHVGPVIFEIARSEIDYTRQRPEEYAAAITAAAIKVGYRGPLFLQGDHFQINARRYAQDPAREVQAVKDLIWEAIDAGFYNIDVDTSTLVDLTRTSVREQQALNYCLAAELTTMIRDLEPPGVTISVGGEIGEVGGRNSTVSELDAFMAGYREELEKDGENPAGLSKISVQTGTTHGGVPLPDGTVARVKLDFATLEELSAAARDRYGLSGAVQHGASTLPGEAFDRFPATGTAEVHLATGFQNIVYDSPNLPEELRDRIYGYVKTTFASERKEEDTEEQFLYKTRKKGLGPFKSELWGLPPENRRILGAELENQFVFLFEKLNVTETWDMVRRYVQPVAHCPKVPAALAEQGRKDPPT